MPNLFSLEIVTSRFLGDTVYPAPPVLSRGPYYQRRIRKWYKRHPAYTIGNGQYFILDNRQVWCHPDDYYQLVEYCRVAGIHYA
jgi:hypothetical protein